MPEYFETTKTSERARKKILNELSGHWQQDDNFFPRFFPVNAYVRETWSKAKPKLHNGSKTNPRWLRVPKDPKSLGPRLYTALNDLLNNILGYFMPYYDDQHPRLFIKTYNRRVLPNIRQRICPAILLAGAGASFVSKTNIRPAADYRSGISPLEVILESADTELAQQRLAIMVQEIFNQQPNRRFTFGLVISASTVTCYLFDHSGVVVSPPLDYHEHPDQFCALIGGLTSTNETEIGLDRTMFTIAGGLGLIQTRDPRRKHRRPVAYYVNGNLYHAPAIIGRSTTCFLAHQGDPDSPQVIKDAWISADDPELVGRESEGCLLLHAKSKGVVRGVAQLRHSEEVRQKGKNGRLFVDDIYHIRRLIPSEYSRVRQRVHTRIVLSTYGKPLEEFSSRKELLVAYYDALRAHRNLYETAGILHRDIKPGNILINADGEDGDRGILIDLDHAIRTDNTSPYSMKKKIGTYLFMSSNVIEGKTRHDYLDDLESFYYILVYMLTMFHGPNAPNQEPPDIIDSWEGSHAASSKFGHFLRIRVPFEIQPWFGQPFCDLVTRLHSQWRKRYMETSFAKTPPPIEPMLESDAFLSHVRQAIAELDQEEATQVNLTVTSTCRPANYSGHSRPKKRSRRDIRPTLASIRSLRQNVTYGRHENY